MRKQKRLSCSLAVGRLLLSMMPVAKHKTSTFFSIRVEGMFDFLPTKYQNCMVCPMIGSTMMAQNS